MKYVLYLSCIDLTILRIPITWRQIERVNATLVVRKMISADHADWCKWRWLIRYVQSPGQRLTITNWDSLLTRTSSENLIFFRIWRLSISLVICPAFQISTKQARKFSHAMDLMTTILSKFPKMRHRNSGANASGRNVCTEQVFRIVIIRAIHFENAWLRRHGRHLHVINDRKIFLQFNLIH